MMFWMTDKIVRQDKRLPLFLLAALVCFYLFNGITYLRFQTLTSDETDFYNYAVRFLKGRPERIYPSADNSKMPVVVLNTLPRIAEQLLQPGQQKNDGGFGDILHGRYVTLAFSVLTILLVFRWAGEMFGHWAGLFAAFLFSFCPNNLANAGLVTTDAYSVFFLLASFYCVWKFCLAPNRNKFLLLSLVVALSQLTKQSLFHLYILLPLAVFIYFLLQRQKLRPKSVLATIAVFGLIQLVVINAGFYFYQTGRSLGSYQFMSTLFQRVQSSLPVQLPVPFPSTFVEGLDQAKYYDQVGGGSANSSFANVTILNQSSTGGSFWYYYLVSLFYKTPITYFFLLIGAAVVHYRRKIPFSSASLFLLLPVVYFLVLFSFFYKTQCGIRHLIFIYPFLFLYSAAIVQGLRSLPAKVFFLFSCLYLAVSVLAYWKNYLPYTNEFILDKTFAYEKVGADNLEFLQCGNFLRQYLREHPEVKPAPKVFQRGTFAISPANYLDQWNRHEFDWIRHYKPVGNIACTYLLIRVP
jgi:hypothetical protein